MTTLDQIHSSHRELFSPSEEFPGWLNYTPQKDTYRNDLKVLNDYRELQIIVTLHLRTKYTPRGFDSNDLRLIDELLSFQGLSICTHFQNLEIIETKNNLKLLSLFGYVNSQYGPPTELSLDLSNLENLQTLWCPVLSHKKSKIDFHACKSLRFLFIPNLENKNTTLVRDIRSLSNLKFLSLHRPTLSSLNEFSRLKQIKGLEVDYARNLESLTGIENWSELEFLDFQNCPNLASIESLKGAKNLKYLRMWSCPNISTLSPLSKLNLEGLDFFESKLLDGDLSFIRTLSNLTYLRFSNRSNFNGKLKQFLDNGEIKESDLRVLRGFYRKALNWD